MTQQKLLIGSLSNDLQRVATLSYRGSEQAAEKFWQSAQVWLDELDEEQLVPYVQNIMSNLKQQKVLQKQNIEDYLMYSILLQNYTLKMK